MTQQKRGISRQSAPYPDVIGHGVMLWFSEGPEDEFLETVAVSRRPGWRRCPQGFGGSLELRPAA